MPGGSERSLAHVPLSTGPERVALERLCRRAVKVLKEAPPSASAFGGIEGGYG
jgi:hypothetical protein